MADPVPIIGGPNAPEREQSVEPTRDEPTRVEHLCVQCAQSVPMLVGVPMQGRLGGVYLSPQEAYGCLLGLSTPANAIAMPVMQCGAFVEQKCRVCGCTQENACEGGCSWVEPDLCSACAEIDEKMEADDGPANG